MTTEHHSGEEAAETGESFMSHLIELRERLMKAVGAVVVVFVILFIYPGASVIYDLLAAPMLASLPEGTRMIATGVITPFMVPLKVTLMAAFVLALPVVLYQAWAFVAPGLYKNERKAFLPFLIATPILFLTGAALVYEVIMPMAWRFFISFEGIEGGIPIRLEAKIGEYLSLVMTLIFAFGMAFQLPVLLTLMVRAGLFPAEALVEKRRFAIVGIFIFAAIVTPPDILSQISLAIPMLVLYELSIVSARWAERQRERALNDTPSE